MIRSVSFADLYAPSSLSYMFADCTALSSFDGANLDASLAADFSSLFKNCSSLTTVTNIETWQTRSATSLASLFEGCGALQTLPSLGKWTTSAVTDLSAAFKGCAALSEIPGIDKWDVSAATDLRLLFEGCSRLRELDLTSWNTTGNPAMTSFFSGCTDLEGLILGASFRFPESADDGLPGLWKLEGGDGRQLDASQVRAAHNASGKTETYTADKPFYAYIDENGTLHIHQNRGEAQASLAMDPTPMPTQISGKSDWPWDSYREQIRSTDISESYYPPTMAQMFEDCVNLGAVSEGETFALRLDARYVTDMHALFKGCKNLPATFTIEGLDTSRVTNMREMFSGCASITSLVTLGLRKAAGDALGWDTCAVTDMSGMFSGCTNLADISPLREWNISSVTTLASMFEDCAALADMAPMASWDLSRVTDLSRLFKGCVSLRRFDAVGWVNSHGPACVDLLSGCTFLREISIGTSFTLSDDMAGAGSSLPADDWQLGGEGDFLTEEQVRENLAEASASQTYLRPFYGVLYENGDLVITRGDGADPRAASAKQIAFRIPLDKIDVPPPPEYEIPEPGTTEAENWTPPEIPPKDYTWPWKGVLDKIVRVSFAESYAPEDAACMFKDCANLLSFDGENFICSEVQDLRGMFEGCSSLALLDLSGWNTAAATDMSRMFYGCSSLEGIGGISGWNTAAVTDMSGMFSGCSSLLELDLGRFDGSALSAMSGIFTGTTSLKRVIFGATFRLNPDTGLSGSWYYDGVGAAMAPEDLRTHHNASGVADSYFTVSGYYALFYEEDGELVFQVGKTPEPGRDTDTIYTLADFENPTSESQIPWLSLGDSIVRVTFRDRIAPKSTAYWFAGLTALEEIAGSGTNLSTRDVIDMREMFRGCASLTALDCAGWDVSKVTSLASAFAGAGIERLDAPFWDLSSCTDLSRAFAACSALRQVNADYWHLPLATTLASMFEGCPVLALVEIREWAPTGTVDMSRLFASCPLLGTGSHPMDLSGIVAPGATTLAHAFEGTGFTSLDAGSWTTENVTDFSCVIANCSNLTALDIEGWTTRGSLTDFFAGSDKIASLTLGEGFSFGESGALGLCGYLRRETEERVTVVSAEQLSGLSGAALAGEWTATTDGYATLDTSGILTLQIGDAGEAARQLSPAAGGEEAEPGLLADGSYLWPLPSDAASPADWPWDTHRGDIRAVRVISPVALGSAAWMLADCPNLTTFDGGALDLSRAQDLSYLFAGCTNLTTVKNLHWNTASATTLASLFEGCTSLTSLVGSGIESWDVSSVTDLSAAFMDTGLTSLNLDGWTTTSLTDVSYLFADCASLASVSLGGWDTSRVLSFEGIFYGCTALNSLAGISAWRTSAAENLGWALADCSSLLALDGAQSWETSTVTSMTHLFAGSGITDAPLGAWNTSALVDGRGIFRGCNALTSVNLSGWNTAAAASSGDLSGLLADTSALNTLTLGREFTFSGEEGLLGGWQRQSDPSAPILSYKDLMMTYDGATMSGSYTRRDAVAVLYGDGRLVFGYRSDLAEEDGAHTYSLDGLTADNPPWQSEKSQIQSVTFSEKMKLPTLAGMFSDCGNLTTFDGANLDPAGISSAAGMFRNCSKLSSVTGLENWDTFLLADSTSMFEGCASLPDLPHIGAWDTTSLSTAARMFADSGLRHLALTNWVLPAVTDMSAMFENCASLSSLDLTAYAPATPPKMENLFAGCTDLASLTLGAGFRAGEGDPTLAGTWKYLGEEDGAMQSGTDLLRNFDGSRPGTYLEVGHLNRGVAVLYEDGSLVFCVTSPGESEDILEEIDLPKDGAVSISALTYRGQITRVSFDPAYATSPTIVPWTSVTDLFADIGALTEVDFTNADLSRVTDFSGLFRNCASLTRVTGLHADAARDLSGMFSGCAALQEIDLSRVKATEAPTLTGMFTGCTPATITLGEGFRGGDGAGLSGKYRYAAKPDDDAVEGDTLLSSYNGSAPGDYVREEARNYGYAVLYDDGRLVFRADPESSSRATWQGTLSFSGSETPGIALANALASHKASVESVSFESGYERVPGFVPWRSIKTLFSGYSALTDVSFASANLAAVTDASAAFQICASLRSVDFAEADLSALQNASDLFSGCSSLISVEIPNLAAVTNLSGMFQNCAALKSVSFPGMNSSRVTSFARMFSGCSSLSEIDLSVWDMRGAALSGTEDLFEGCDKLTTVTFGAKGRVTKISYGSYQMGDSAGLSGDWRRTRDNSKIELAFTPLSQLSEQSSLTGTYRKIGATGSLTVEARAAQGSSPASHTYTLTLAGYDPNTSSGALAAQYSGLTFTGGVSDPFTLTDGESRTFENLPAGLSYTVTETPADGVAVEAVGDSGKIVADEVQSAIFTHTSVAPTTHTLTVTSQVTGSMGSQSKAFAFTLTLTRDGAPYNEEILVFFKEGASRWITPEEGVYSFTLTSRNAITFTALPLGVTYKVAAVPVQGYTITVTEGSDTGVIADDNPQITFELNREGRVPTAAHIGTGILALALLAVIPAAALILRSRRRRRGEK